jgi:HK97 family phage major capsid protein
MNKEKYLAKRNALLEEAQNLVNEAKFEEFNTKKEEIEKLDQDFENEAKAQANINALKDNVKVTNIQNKGVNVLGTVIDSTNNSNIDDMYASLEYRKAFMNNVIKGTPIPGEFSNIDSNTKSSDVGSVIPTTVMEKIIEKLEATGMILPLVTRTSYKGGVTIPISTVKPIATWVAEGSGSDKQKKTTGSITFSYYKLRCAVSVSFETDNIALSVFETTLINNIVEAMTKALEQAIINGTGEGQPKGILAETPVTGQAIGVAKADGIGYETLTEAEGALPLEYESGAVWCMTKKTFMSFIGLTDTNGQPIARVNYGVGGKPERTLLGRQVILTNYLPSYSLDVDTDTTFAFLFNFKDYILNTNYAMTLKKYEDNNTDDQVTKAIMLADGKVVDKNSLVTLFVDVA